MGRGRRDGARLHQAHLGRAAGGWVPGPAWTAYLACLLGCARRHLHALCSPLLNRSPSAGELYMKAMELQKAGRELIFTNGERQANEKSNWAVGGSGDGACRAATGCAAAQRTRQGFMAAIGLQHGCSAMHVSPAVLSYPARAHATSLCPPASTPCCPPLLCEPRAPLSLSQWATRSSWASSPSPSTARWAGRRHTRSQCGAGGWKMDGNGTSPTSQLPTV